MFDMNSCPRDAAQSSFSSLCRFKPFRNGPDRDSDTGLAEAQGKRCCPRPRPGAEIERIVLLPLTDGVWMPSWEAYGIVVLRRTTAKSPNLVNLHVPKYPMMAVAAVARSKQTEEKKHVTDPNAIRRQMRLSGARLSKRPTSI